MPTQKYEWLYVFHKENNGFLSVCHLRLSDHDSDNYRKINDRREKMHFLIELIIKNAECFEANESTIKKDWVENYLELYIGNNSVEGGDVKIYPSFKHYQIPSMHLYTIKIPSKFSCGNQERREDAETLMYRDMDNSVLDDHGRGLPPVDFNEKDGKGNLFKLSWDQKQGTRVEVILKK